jgi:hypothetical protein
VALTDGRTTPGITRRGDQLLRPTGPWSPAVHEYLRYLESAGFAGAPRLAGLEDGFEVVSYLDGDVPSDPDWEPGHGSRLPPYARTDRALSQAARLIRELHRVSAAFTPAVTGYRFHPHPPLPGEIVSHGDLGPWNTVYRDGLPVAFIDWDSAQPTDPLTELASAAWAFVPLAPASQLAESGFDPLPDLPARLRMFLDAYGLADRTAILPALQRSVLTSTEHVKDYPIGPADAAATLEYHAHELRWLTRVSADLADAL